MCTICKVENKISEVTKSKLGPRFDRDSLECPFVRQTKIAAYDSVSCRLHSVNCSLVKR